MMIGAISGTATQGPLGRRPGQAAIEATSAGARAGGERREERFDAPRGALVAAGPSPSTGPRAPLRHSAPFVAQVAAAYLGNLAEGERRVDRRPELIADKAGATYRRSIRLATELETGFLVTRDF